MYDKIVFLSIPFKGTEGEMMEKIDHYSRKIARYFWEKYKENAIILHSYNYYSSDENSKLFGFSQAIYLMGMSDYICMVDDWRHAGGCLIERDIAIKYGIPVIYETNGEFSI